MQINNCFRNTNDLRAPASTRQASRTTSMRYPWMLSLVCAMMLAVSGPQYALAQQDAPDEAKALPPVEVVGSRLKRTDLETPTPVFVITREDIRNSGAISTRELVNSISPASGGGIDDLGVGTGFSSGTSTLSLRGLGSSATLILLNGRRIPASPVSDPTTGQSLIYNLNAIPPSAIERVEVLKAGASALYGSDAIAGVVNIVLRQDYRGAEAGLDYSFNQDGNFGNRRAYGIVGFGDDGDGNGPRYGGYLLFANGKRDRTTVPQTRGVEEADLTRIFNRNSPASSTASYPPNYFIESTPGSGVFDEFFARDTRCPPELVLPSERCGFNRHQVSDTVSPQESNSILGRVNFPVRSTLSLFTEFGLSRVESEHVIALPAVAESGSVWFAENGQRNFFQFVLPPGHPDNPATVPAALRYRFADVSPSSFRQTTDNARLLVGAKGSTAGWEWESAFLYHRISLDWVNRGFLHFPGLVNAINTQAYRPFGNNSPETIASISPEIRESARSAIGVWDLKATRQLTELAGGPMAVATGVEARKEEFRVTPDTRTVNGEFIGLGASQANGNRRVASLFAELSAPFMKRVESQMALRFDHYSDFGNSTTPQLGIKWKPVDSLALRASYAKGFRAPSLSTISDASTQGFEPFLNDPVRCDQAGSTPDDCDFTGSQLVRSNPDLKPEKSDGQTIGLVFSPNPDFDMSIDFYRISRTNEVGLLDTQFIIDNEARFPGAVIRNPNPATWLAGIPNSGPIQSTIVQYRNLGRTVTSGVDLEATMRNSFGQWGALKTRFSATYLNKYKFKLTADDPYVEAQGGFGPIGELPRFKGTVATTWTYRDVSVTGRINHVSGWRFGDGANECFEQNPAYLERFQCKIKPWTTMDLLVRYDGVKNLELGFGVRNLQNKAAPFDPNNPDLGFNPDFHNPYGRLFNIWLRYKFL